MTKIRRPMKATSSPQITERYQPKHIYNLKFDKTPYSKKLNFNAPTVDLPKSVDLRSSCPPVWSQEQLGSCTTFGILGAFQYDELQIGSKFEASKLFLYYLEREADHDTQQDSGSSVSQGVHVLHTRGVCSENEWPYNIKKFAVKPPMICYKHAMDHRIKRFHKIDNSHQNIRKALSYNKVPVVIGMMIYESFESEAVAKTGTVPMPKHDETILGGHCILICGYDMDQKHYICRNSWGPEWGDKGYFYLPFDYVEDINMASDAWQILDLEKETVKQTVENSQINDTAKIELVKVEAPIAETVSKNETSQTNGFWSYFGY